MLERPSTSEHIKFSFADDEPQDMTFKEGEGEGEKNPEDKGIIFQEEDPVIKAVQTIMERQKILDGLVKAESLGKSTKTEVQVARILLLKEQYNQAVLNERLGKGAKGAKEKLLADWRSAQQKLEDMNKLTVSQIRDGIRKIYEGDGKGEIGVYTAEQISRNP